MLMTKLFQTDDALMVTDLAYEDIYNDYAGNIKPYELANFEPAVICSPKKTGKTTQANRIHNTHKRFQRQSNIPLIKIQGEDITEEQLGIRLKDELQSKQSATLSEIIDSSSIILNKNQYVFLAIIDSHKFPINTIRWILYGIREINERKNPLTQYKLQIVIDGSFAMDTLTTGPNSEFPMPQLYPREFTEQEQKNFINTRLKKIGLKLNNGACKIIWEVTHGDKYFTQALSRRASEHYNQTSKKEIQLEDNEIIDCVEKYMKESPYEDDLKPYLFSSFSQISSFCQDESFNILELVKEIDSHWIKLPKDIRALAYDGGMVRRKNELEIEIRAPIVLKLLEQLEVKARQIRSLLGYSFSLKGVRPDYYEVAKKSLEQINSATYLSCLRTLHIGPGHKISDNEISINAAAFGHGTYTGRWEVRTDKSISIGDEVWGLLWSYENEKGEIEGHLKVFPVQI